MMEKSRRIKHQRQIQEDKKDVSYEGNHAAVIIRQTSPGDVLRKTYGEAGMK
jgi:hypothetical protein